MSSNEVIDVRAQLLEGLTDYRKTTLMPLIERLEEQFKVWVQLRLQGMDRYSLEVFLAFQVENYLENIEKLRDDYGEFLRRYGNALDEHERRQQILTFCKTLGASENQLKQDAKAFNRWFAVDAVGDRFQRKLASMERELETLLEWQGNVGKRLLQGQEDMLDEWRQLEMERSFNLLLSYQGDERVRVAAFTSLATVLEALPGAIGESAVSPNTLRYIYRSALDQRQDLWIQRAAIRLLRELSAESFQKAVEERLKSQTDRPDDFFLRSYAVELIAKELSNIKPLVRLLKPLCNDPSPTVRQRLAVSLKLAPAYDVMQVLRLLAIEDQEPCVRAAAVLAVPNLMVRPELHQPLLNLCIQVMDQEQDDFVLRVVLKVATDVPADLSLEIGNIWLDRILPAIEMLNVAARSKAVRRWSAQARERTWVQREAQAKELFKQLKQYLNGLKAGRRRRLPWSLGRVEPLVVTRVLAVMAQNDYGYSLERGMLGLYVRRGEDFGFRLWRMLHEWATPSPDKRQAHQHSIGRHYYGLYRAPSCILAELAETKVPGEPLFIAAEQSWRPYLPLLDEVISSLDQGWPTRPYNIVSADGVTELFPPRSIFRRLWAKLLISWNFQRYAAMRNWDPKSTAAPDEYLQLLVKLGFQIRIVGHLNNEAKQRVDSHVSQFFPAFIPIPMEFDVAGFWRNVSDYFVSVYENSMLHLGIFITAATAYFFGRHIYVNRQLRAARNRLALVIGGWGTRGKSGTERLKAALFNALGYSIVSKTTGCEAMFIVSPPNGRLREMFLFRPYEKATIWEQFNLVRFADRLKTEVFLWECMGLTPSYIHILQHHWMRDDISTITNTYPDHEDLQGPAGYDIPTVMTRFVPPQTELVTSEEQMLPILRDAARKNQTKLHTVGWLQAGLLAPDILERFPYEEHPYNIALVIGMARALGIERDFALKEMADRVVPDLGVLKAYPWSWLMGRRMRYIMGMSANERFGTLNNWSRMGFDQMQRETRPEIWVAAVVNNRADRIPRSRVFAEIMVNDLAVDRYLLIGANLNGLLGYIEEAWQASSDRLNLWTGEKTPPQRLREMAQQLRVATDEDSLKARLKAALSGLGVGGLGYEQHWQDPDKLRQCLVDTREMQELLDFYQQDLQALQQYQALLSQLKAGKSQQELLSQWQKLAWQWFRQKLVVLYDYHASGNEVVETLAKACHPGLLSEIMGLQNIKGTGLDFVYRWQAWESCHKLCLETFSEHAESARQALSRLAQFTEYGPLGRSMVAETIVQVAQMRWAQKEEVQAELSLIQTNLDQEISKSSQQQQQNVKKESSQSRFQWLKDAIEAFFDSGDAVKRRKQADRIYRDLANEHISLDRAALELQKLNKRQKGGWMFKS